MERVYLAAPFFNPLQMELVRRIEERLAAAKHIAWFSPRLQHGDLPSVPPVRTTDQAKEILERNVNEVRLASLVLAVVDWLVPIGQYVRQFRLLPGSDVYENGQLVRFGGEPRGPVLNLPDTGTVWETGLAYGLRIPVVMFTTAKSPIQRKINVMLAQSAEGVLCDLDELEKFLLPPTDGRYGAFDWTIPHSWPGGYR